MALHTFAQPGSIAGGMQLLPCPHIQYTAAGYSPLTWICSPGFLSSVVMRVVLPRPLSPTTRMRTDLVRQALAGWGREGPSSCSCWLRWARLLLVCRARGVVVVKVARPRGAGLKAGVGLMRGEGAMMLGGPSPAVRGGRGSAGGKVWAC
jgi:hypothetical protein